jgi:hypothetical protein
MLAPSIGSQGFDQKSNVYDTSKMNPEFRDIVQKAGIRKSELSSVVYAPVIRAVLMELELR